MTNIKIDKKDEMVMKILHYFVTEENYKPIFFKDAINEIWLENLDAPYKIVRININYLHNNVQCKTDLAKAEYIMKKIKKKTFSFKMNMLNLLIDTGETVEALNSNNIRTKIINKISDLKKDKEIKEEYPKIEKISNKKTDMEDFIKLTEDMNNKNLEEEKKFSKYFIRRPALVTNTLIIINVILFVLMYLIGNGSTDTATLLDFGANYGPFVKMGEVYRLLTCAFLHIGLLHLLFNMYALKIIGNEIERYYGRVKYLIIYLGSAVLGSLFSCLFTDGVSAGASGAIFGLFGALMYFGYHHRLILGGFLTGQIIPIVILNLLLGLFIPGIDISAHIGGLIGGFALSMAVGISNKTGKRERINGIIISLILFIFTAYLLFFLK